MHKYTPQDYNDDKPFDKLDVLSKLHNIASFTILLSFGGKITHTIALSSSLIIVESTKVHALFQPE